jgi:diguanylate cyclase (GGDEF)-like protein/putative nucleotidyltransferase with HDIG domain
VSALGSSVPAPAAESAATGPQSLPFRAAVYLAVVSAAAVVLAIPALRGLSLETPGWPTFLLLTAGAAFAQLFTVRTRRNYSYHTTGVFLVPAVLLLPASLVVLMPLAQRAPDWARRRAPWTAHAFNIAAYTLAVLAALGGVHLVRAVGGDGPAELALAGLVAMTLFVVVQGLVSAPMLMLVRRCSLSESGVFTFHGLSTEFVLAALGVGVAFLWGENPWLVPFALAPLLIVHRSLSVPLLEAEARVDAKTGLFNARHFATSLESEFGRAQRFARPVAVVMADLDLLREVNNTYGHLAGDAVLHMVAEVLRGELRHYDVPARFGGEEFAVVLPETGAEEAAEIAERIRAAVAARRIEVETAAEPIGVTISIGVAAYPADAETRNDLVHQADVAVYRAKLQGRNRVVRAGREVAITPAELADEPTATASSPDERVSLRLPVSGLLLWGVGLLGIGVGAAGLIFGADNDLLGMLAVVGIAALVQALADASQEAASVSAVGVLSGAALFGPRVALAIALAACTVEWGRTRIPFSRLAFDIGSLTFAGLAAAAVFALRPEQLDVQAALVVAGLAAGAAYFLVTAAFPTALAARAAGVSIAGAWRMTLGWTLLQHLSAGLLAGVVAIAYDAAGLWTLALLAVPLLLARSTQDREATRAQRTALELQRTVDALQRRTDALTQANEALRSHSTALMSALATRMDDRETAGHSREVQRLAVAMGVELRLSGAELDILAHAALFHDVGKLAVPDAVLLKADALTENEWEQLRKHAGEGARLVERLAFLRDAVPSIRHHHERYDGRGYPDGLNGEEIPLGARIIHVAEATVAILNDRLGQPDTADYVVAELRRCAGTQFCPRCVGAMETIARNGLLEGVRPPSGLELVS